jgi:predicted TIM-barrel fold metal-dependent hydrolase
MKRNFEHWRYRAVSLAVCLCLSLSMSCGLARAQSNSSEQYEFNDSHFHLTNYIQEGIDIHKFLKIMGNKVGRVAIFGIPLQQEWSYENTGDFAPTYYMQTDAPLYYYSFTDAYIAMAYKSLTKAEQARFDPMITGFNPADMYAVDHIRRVLQTFPGVFTGIGEFTIHKEFVSSKIAGGAPSLQNPALDRILDFAAQVGLVVIIHNDIDTPYSGNESDTPSSVPGPRPVYLSQMQALIKRHPKTTIIWAHTGMGRIVRPIKAHAKVLDSMLSNPAYSNLYFDLSWSEVAKYIVSSPAATQAAANLINRYPDRFLFGTDEVAPSNQEQYLRVYNQYAPLWKLLNPKTREKVLKGNYDRLFDRARLKVRAWERAQGFTHSEVTK